MDRIDFLKSIDGHTATSIESLQAFFDHYMSAYDLVHDSNYNKIISHQSHNHISLKIETSEEEKNILINKINQLNNYMVTYNRAISVTISVIEFGSITIDFMSI